MTDWRESIEALIEFSGRPHYSDETIGKITRSRMADLRAALIPALAQPTPAWRLFKDDGSYIVTDKRGAAVHWGAAGQMVEEIGRELRAAQPPAAPVAPPKTPFMMLSCREAKQCLHQIPGCICDGDPTLE